MYEGPRTIVHKGEKGPCDRNWRPDVVIRTNVKGYMVLLNISLEITEEDKGLCVDLRFILISYWCNFHYEVIVCKFFIEQETNEINLDEWGATQI